MIWKFRIPGRDVTGNPLAEAEVPKDAKRPGQPLLAMEPLLRKAAEAWWREILQRYGAEFDPIDRAWGDRVSHTHLTCCNPCCQRLDLPTQWRWVYVTTASTHCSVYNHVTFWSSHDIGTGRPAD